MKILKISGGPSQRELLVSLGLMVLSRGRETFEVTFKAEDPDGGEAHIEHDYVISGVNFYQGSNGPIALLPPTSGPGAPAQRTTIIYYPDGESHKGHIEIDDSSDQTIIKTIAALSTSDPEL